MHFDEHDLVLIEMRMGKSNQESWNGKYFLIDA